MHYYIGPIQIYSGAEVSHTNRCRSVGTLRHRCRSVRRTLRSVRTLRHYNLVPNCPGAEVSWCRSVPIESICPSSHLRGYKAVVHDALLVWTKDSTVCMVLLFSPIDEYVYIIYRPSSCYYCYYYCYVHLILCTLRSLRVTVTINKVLSYLTVSTNALEDCG